MTRPNELSDQTSPLAVWPEGASLYRRGLLLVVIPILIQIGLLALLFRLSSVSDSYAVDAALTRTRTLQVRDLVAAEAFILTSAGVALTDHTAIDPQARKRLDLLADLLGIIDKDGGLLPPGAKSLQELRKKTGQILIDIDSQKLSEFMKKGSVPPVPATGTQAVSAFRSESGGIIEDLEEVLNRDQKFELKENPADLNMRRWLYFMAFAGTFLNLLSMLAVAFVFNRELVQRLLLLHDNTRRFAAGEELLAPMRGNDEIAQVDAAFHKMSRALHESARREEILFNSVKTVLASLDRHGRIKEINNTVREVLGFKPDGLIGKHLQEIVAEDFKKQADTNLKKVCAGSEAPFELPLVKKDGTVADTTWSVKYAAQDENLFCVVQDDTERRAAERVRKQVLQMVSHDLRSPISTVMITYQLLETGRYVDLTSAGRDRLSIAMAKAVTMLTLVDNLLDIEKIEAGMLTLEREIVPAHLIVRCAIDRFIETIRARKIEIFEAGLNLTVYGDEFRLIQILTNLLSLAIRRSPQGGKIRIAAQADKGMVTISVADQGPIISAEQVAKMFARYSETANPRGRGSSAYRPELDLIICRSLIDLHGGKISAVNQSDRGTIFQFSIPDKN